MTKDEIRIETQQNWFTFCLISFGIGFGVVLPIALCFLLAGVIASLVLVIKRSLSKKPKRLTILTIVSILCWIYMLSSVALMVLAPSVFNTMYGNDLGGVAKWAPGFLLAGVIGLVSIVIELFRVSSATVKPTA
jgi:hypothetical protein